MVKITSAPDYKWPEQLKAMGWTGLGENILRSWTTLLAADTGIKVTITGTPDTVSRFRAVHSGEAHITAGGAGELARMLEAVQRYAGRDTGPFQLRVVWAQSRSNSGFFVRGDSPIRTIYDIKPGVRMPDMRTYIEDQPIVDAILAWAKVKEEDVVWVPAENAAHKAELVVEGKADIAFAIPTAESIKKAERGPHGIRWIDLNPETDPEGARRFLTVKPMIAFGPIFSGVPSSIGHWGTCGTSLYFTREQTDAGFVYHLARWLDENHSRFRGLHPWNEFMRRDILLEELKRTFIPCHEGLVAYLKGPGLWTTAHDRRQKANIELISRYCTAYDKAIATADTKGIPVEPKSASWVELWENYKRELGLPPFRVFQSLN